MAMALNPQEKRFITSLNSVIRDLRRGLPLTNVYDPLTGRFFRNVPKTIALSIIQRYLGNRQVSLRRFTAGARDIFQNLRILASKPLDEFEKDLTKATTAAEVEKIDLETSQPESSEKEKPNPKEQEPEKSPQPEKAQETARAAAENKSSKTETAPNFKPVTTTLAQTASQEAKNIVSSAAIKIRQTIANHPTVVQSISLSLAGAAIGGIITQNPTGALVGAGIAAATPLIFKQMREASDPRKQIKPSLFKGVTNKIATTIAQNKTASLLTQSLATGVAGASVGLLTPLGPGLGFSAGASLPFILRSGFIPLFIKGISNAANTAGDILEGRDTSPGTSQEISLPSQTQSSGSRSTSNQGHPGGLPSIGRGRPGRPKGAVLGLFRGGLNNPWVWVIAIILVMLASFALGFFGDGKTGEAAAVPSGASVSLVKSGPPEVADNNVEITYKITATFKGKGLASFKVFDPLPPETTFISAKSNPSGNIPCQSRYEGKIDPIAKGSSGETVVWDLTGLTANSAIELCVTIKSNQNDVWLVNKASSRLDPGSVIGGEKENLEVVVATGPAHVDSVNDQISYQIVATYKGSGTAKIQITNPLPENSEFISGDQQGNCESQASPTQTDPTPLWGPFELTQGQSAKVCLTIRPTTDKIKLTEIARAKIVDLNLPPSAAGSGDFDSLMTNRGRDTNVLGDETTFVTTVMKNGAAKIAGKETQVRQIYQVATAKQINPLAVLTIWGVEQGWRSVPSPFGCPSADYPTFDSQVSCAVNTLNSWMSKFEKSGQKSLIIEKESCTYFDAFAYAYEWYTPICHVYDKNEHSRKNFVDYYKGFLGN